MSALTGKRCNNRVLKHGEPTFVGIAGDYVFFECPRYGDESPLLTRVNGEWFETDFWDVPTIEELEDS